MNVFNVDLDQSIYLSPLHSLDLFSLGLTPATEAYWYVDKTKAVTLLVHKSHDPLRLYEDVIINNLPEGVTQPRDVVRFPAYPISVLMEYMPELLIKKTNTEYEVSSGYGNDAPYYKDVSLSVAIYRVFVQLMKLKLINLQAINANLHHTVQY